MGKFNLKYFNTAMAENNNQRNDGSVRYNMENPQRGKLIIFSNQNFNTMQKREGADKDAARIHRAFKNLDFKVVIQKDKQFQDMQALIKKEAQADHTNEDCFAIFISTYGNEWCIYSVDEVEIALDQLIEPLKKCNSLVGKPKLIFIEASLGDKEEIVSADGKTENKKLSPIEADFLYSYSTVPGYKSQRSSDADAWYCDALVNVLREQGRHLEINEILTRVIGQVTQRSKLDGKHQYMHVPSFVSTLTKQLYFTQHTNEQ